MPSIVFGSAMNTAMPRARSRVDLRRRRVGPGDDEVRRERDDALEIDRVDVADARAACVPRGGQSEVSTVADDAVAGARREHELGRVRREAHDPPRRRGERTIAPASSIDPHAGARDAPRRTQCERRHASRCRGDAHRNTARTPAYTVAPPVA